MFKEEDDKNDFRKNLSEELQTLFREIDHIHREFDSIIKRGQHE